MNSQSDDRQAPFVGAGEADGVTAGRINVEEAPLCDSDARFRTLINDIATVAVQGYSRDGTTRYWNRGSELLYGYAREEALGHNLLELIIPPEMRESVKQTVQRMLETGEPVPRQELSLMRKDGTRVCVISTHALIPRSDGEMELFCLDVDISKLRKTEKEREELHAQLLQAQKIESVGRLAGGVAHDFNNMLGAILGNAELAMDHLAPSDPVQENLQEIIKAARRSARVTGQLLAFARRQPSMPQVLDLNDTLVEMIPAIRRIIGEHISLSWTPGSTVGQVIIDPAQLRQILTNLCLNAREAVSVSGKITLGTDRRIFGCLDCAHYAEATPGEFALITVGDNGCGMNRETLEHLFEPFFSTRGVGEGSGLGLATVYGIVKQNNGFVNVHSEPGQGSTFEIYLPHHAEIAEKPRQTLHPPPLPRAQGEQVLLVEDEPSILRLCVSILEKLGYGVLAATTPGEALRLVEQEARPIDLLFTDVIMPGMNGQELAKLLKSRYPRIKTLFMSGYTANVITHHGVLDAGVQFIQKPFSMQDLAVRIRRVLDNP